MIKFILLPLYSLISYRSALYRLVPIILNLDLNRTLPYQLSPLPKQGFLTPTPLTRPQTCPVLIEMSPHATTFHYFCFGELQFRIKFTICIWNIFLKTLEFFLKVLFNPSNIPSLPHFPQNLFL